MARKRLFIVAGFLGAGKTTLMRELMRCFPGETVAAVVNEFGEVGIDGSLLASEGVRVEEITGGSVFCVCRSDLFVDALVGALHSQSDVVLVETSGLSDPTGIHGLLKVVTQVAGESYDFMGVIAMVDAPRFLKLLKTAVAVRQQVTAAGLVLVNKVDLTQRETVAEVIDAVADLNPFAAVHETVYSHIRPEWLEELTACQKEIHGGIVRHTLGVSKALIDVPKGTDEAVLMAWLHSFAANTYRIKGFVRLNSGWKLVDATSSDIHVSETSERTESNLVVLSSSLNVIKKAQESFAQVITQGGNAD